MAARSITYNNTTRLVGAKRAASEYGFAYTSLRDIVHRGEIPLIRIGRAWYLERGDVEAWIRRKKAESRPC